jgi:hypothetical protein
MESKADPGQPPDIAVPAANCHQKSRQNAPPF